VGVGVGVGVELIPPPPQPANIRATAATEADAAKREIFMIFPNPVARARTARFPSGFD
jgi:hypothetical protein